MTISERIFLIMAQKDIKPSALADSLGVSRSVVSAWKTRNSSPSAELIINICKFLDVTAEFLLNGENNNNVLGTLGTAQLQKATAMMSEPDRLLLAGAILQEIRQHGHFDAAAFLAPAAAVPASANQRDQVDLDVSASDVPPDAKRPPARG